MIIERNEKTYSVRYEGSDQILCEFRNLDIASLYVRYLSGCQLSESDEYILREEIRKHDKKLKSA